MNHIYKTVVLGTLVLFAFPAHAQITSVQYFLIASGYFLNNVIVPFLIAVALLIFLVNAVRYFIIQGSSEDGQEKAKRLMLYGIGAFVFIVSIWGIVNLIVNGLQINYRASICPDYLPSCGNDVTQGNTINAPGRTVTDVNRSPGPDTRNPGGTYTGGTGGTGTGGTDTGGTGGTGTGGTGTGGATNQCGTGAVVPSGIADLVFGNYQDDSSLSFANPTAAAIASTPTISDTESCFNAMNTLQLAADVENNQVAYMLYTDSAGVRHWKNVTDATSATGVAYNANEIAALTTAGATNIYLIHTHQRSTAQAAGVSSDGYPPSAADMQIMCDPLLNNVTHVTVDWNHVWVLDQPSTACPRQSNATYEFPIIESLLQVSQVSQGSRNQEYYDLSNSSQVPSNYRNSLSTYCSVDLDSYSDIIVGGTTNQSLAAANLSLQRQDVNAFCSNLGG